MDANDQTPPSQPGTPEEESGRRKHFRRLGVHARRWGLAALLTGTLAFPLVVSATTPHQSGNGSGGAGNGTAQTGGHPAVSPQPSPSSSSNQVTMTTKDGRQVIIKNPTITVQQPPDPATAIIESLLPFLLIGGALYFLMIRPMMQAQKGGGIMGMRKAKGMLQERPKTTFGDVAGYDEVKADLLEIVDFLRNPARYEALGARMPRGVLLYGPPGTGKTLMARATAGEAGAAFFAMSASEFVEMLVGLGASRVRDLFNTARQNQPAIIFIDEIDAIGGRRGGDRVVNGNSEQEQTLNQILSEMDGFLRSESIVVMAATNRPDILDPALTRPGRFDRQREVGLPDLPTRRKILDVHVRGKPLAHDVDLDSIARQTMMNSGAFLEQIVNEAALLAAREGATSISNGNLQEGLLRAEAGPTNGRILTDDEKRIVAYHEAGHALAAHLEPDGDRVEAISIVPRGQALGLTSIVPERDQVLLSRDQLMARMVALHGGRAAEIVLNGPGGATTGPSSDVQRATDIATSMVADYAMSELAPMVYRSVGRFGEAQLDDDAKAEVRRLVTDAAERAQQLLQQNRGSLDALAKALLARQNLTRGDLVAIVGASAKELMAQGATPPDQGLGGIAV